MDFSDIERILELVRERELSAGEIASQFEITRPAISQHLTILREAGLLAERREGTRRLYRLRLEGLAELRAFLAELWPDALQRFKAAAEAPSEVPRSAPNDPTAAPDRGVVR